jgi:hypothetical protein
LTKKRVFIPIFRQAKKACSRSLSEVIQEYSTRRTAKETVIGATADAAIRMAVFSTDRRFCQLKWRWEHHHIGARN